MMAFLLAMVVLAVILTIGNLVAQRMLPTKTNDGLGRRVGYRLLVRITVAAVALGFGALLALFSR